MSYQILHNIMQITIDGPDFVPPTHFHTWYEQYNEE